jgi:SM-20-related protein
VGDLFEQITVDLVTRGWSVGSGLLTEAEIAGLHDEAVALLQAGRLRSAETGRGAERARREQVRGDRILWIDGSGPTAAQRPFVDALERLRQHLNRELFIGLWDTEIQLAAYAPGTFYRRHIDQLRGRHSRKITFVLYLNPGWRASDGGELRLYPEPDAPFVDVPPEANRFVCFRSDRVEHEVRECRRLRFSLSGWLRAREPPAV